jgi:CBS domain-containing protein
MAAVLHAGAGVVVAASAAADRFAVKCSEGQQWRQVSCVSSSWQRGSSQFRMIGVLRSTEQKRGGVVVKAAAGEGVETGVETKVSGDVLPSAEWPENFSLLNFEDLISHYEPGLFKAEAQPGTYLADIMSKTLFTAFPHQLLSEIVHFFDQISGIPIVDEGYKVVGVLSKKDKAKAAAGENPRVKDLMSSPAITLSADKTVQDAAVLMLKNKVHRIPIVNADGQVVGIVTRTDIFTALDSDPNMP